MGGVSITNFGFVIDNRRCIGCHACTVACKAEHDDPIGVNKTWVKYIEKGSFPDTNRSFSVMRCNHCDDSPCTDVCPVTALWEREDGIVDFDPERCIGCKACMQGCPYDALYIDPETHTAAKCNYCSHRVDTGREPACVTVCPEDAIIAGDVENTETEIAETVSRQDVQVRKPEKGTEPKLFYVDGDDASLTPGATGRSEHYMWSDAPRHVQTEGGEKPDFDLARAAQSLADSDVSFQSESSSEARTDGGCARDGSCGCQESGTGASESGDDRAVMDGGTVTDSTAKGAESSRTAAAYELLTEEASRVYDVDENHHGSWGWEVYSYTWTKSIAAGIVLLPALLMMLGLIPTDLGLLGGSAVIGGAFLAVTGFLLIIDLERPGRFHWVLLRPNWSSWLVKGAYIITAYGMVLGALVAGWYFDISLVAHPVSLGLVSVLAAATAVYTGLLLGQSKGRDLWQSPATPIHMLVQAVVAGGAALLVIGSLGIGALAVDAGVLAGILGGGLVIHAGLVVSELFMFHQTEDAEEAAARIVRGDFNRVFWAGAIAIGIIVPLGALAGGIALTSVLAGVCALGGLLAYEYCWITAPQTISLA